MLLNRTNSHDKLSTGKCTSNYGDNLNLFLLYAAISYHIETPKCVEENIDIDVINSGRNVNILPHRENASAITPDVFLS